MRGIVLVLFSMFFSSYVFAQRGNILGKVIGPEGEGMQRVAITKNGDTESESSGKNGIFTIAATKGDSLSFLLPGYIRRTILVVDSFQDITVELKKIVPKVDYYDPLSEKISTAGKKGAKISDIPASIVLVTSKEIELFGYKTLEDVFLNVPGLYEVNDHSWTGAGPLLGVRGFLSTGFNNNIIILVNGVNQLEDYWGYYPLSRLNVPVDAIDRIEIIRGPMSVQYGSGAFFGAINIITNDNFVTNDYKHNYTKTIVSGNYGDDLSHGLNATVKRNGNDSLTYYTMTAGVNSTPGLNQDFSDMVSDYSGNVASSKGLLEDRRTFMGFSGRVKNITLNLNLSQSDKGMFSNSGVDNAISEEGGSVTHMLGGNGQLGYSKYFFNNNLLLLDVKTGFSTHRSNQDFAAAANIYGLGSYSSNAYEIVTNGTWDLSDNFELATGVYFRSAYDLHTTYDLPKFGTGNNIIRIKDHDKKQIFGLMSQGNYTFREKLEVVAGIRMEYVPGFNIETLYDNVNFDTVNNVVTDTIKDPVSRDFGDRDPIFIPRIAVIYKFNSKNIIKLMFGQGTKQASFGQYSDIISSQSSLAPSTITTYEVNFLHTIVDTTKRNHVVFNTSIFRNELKDLINRSSKLNNEGVSEYVSANSGIVNTNGVELGIKTSLMQNKLFLDVSVSIQNSTDETEYYTDTTQLNTAKIGALSFSPEVLGYFKIGYTFMINEEKSRKFTVAVNSRFVDKMNSEFDVTVSNNEANGYIADNVSEYFIHDLNLNYSFSKKVSLSLKAYNVLDKKYHYPVTRNNSWVDRGFLGRGRWITTQLKCMF